MSEAVGGGLSICCKELSGAMVLPSEDATNAKACKTCSGAAGTPWCWNMKGGTSRGWMEGGPPYCPLDGGRDEQHRIERLIWKATQTPHSEGKSLHGLSKTPHNIRGRSHCSHQGQGAKGKTGDAQWDGGGGVKAGLPLQTTHAPLSQTPKENEEARSQGWR